MAREHNYLLGNGQKLTGAVEIPKGGGPKNPPYDFSTAQGRLSARLSSALRIFTSVPEDAKPRGEVVALLTMHPRYVSKSDYPLELLAAVGLRSVGSRSSVIRPDSWASRNILRLLSVSKSLSRARKKLSRVGTNECDHGLGNKATPNRFSTSKRWRLIRLTTSYVQLLKIAPKDYWRLCYTILATGAS